MHRMQYHHYDDSNLLDISYDLTIEFDWDEGQPGDRIDPPIPPHTTDVRIVAATMSIGSSGGTFANKKDLETMNQMLNPSLWKHNEAVRITSQRFVDDIETAIAEHLDEQDQAACESAAEARFQAMRDGE
jgi:hypothetical protein